ncbi:MAG: hypothetical protein JWO42_1740 [Chloroflexi bacterium]|jgi:hypothetical protein|nr:hypothetical protein [Chloroflexota bacterium]
MARYDAYLLRIWRSGDEEHGQWALRLQHLPDGTSVRFSSLESLLAHLRSTLGSGSGCRPDPENSAATGLAGEEGAAGPID